MWGRWLVGVNAVVRLGYGLPALASPSKPAFGKVPIAPDTDELPEARLFVRAFAAHQIAVALVGVAGVVQPGLRRPGMLLAATTDLTDIASALVEASARGRLDSDLRGGIVFSAAGLASALAALWDWS
jgi:hypothetical protein